MTLEGARTIVGDGHRMTRREDGEDRRIRHLRRIVEGILDPHTREVRARAVPGGDGECVGRECVQSASGVIEELEGLVSGVGERGDDLEVLNTVDSVSAGDLE